MGAVGGYTRSMSVMLPLRATSTTACTARGAGALAKANARAMASRLTLLLLALVLLLGPFLHAHAEASPIEGFHLNGLAMLSVDAQDSDSDAVSVGAYSLFTDAASALGSILALLAIMWLHALCWAPRRIDVRPSPPRQPHPAVRAWHEPGRPPPALAPPAH